MSQPPSVPVLFSRCVPVLFSRCVPVLFSHAARARRVWRSAVVGEIDEEADAELALDEIMAEPLKPVVH